MAGLGFEKFLHDIGIDIDAFSTMTSVMAGAPLPFSNSAVVQPAAQPWPNPVPAPAAVSPVPAPAPQALAPVPQAPLPYDPTGMSDPAKAAFSGLMDAWGQPLTVTSAYRSPEHNANVGGAKHSEHTKGNAFDISVAGMPEEQRVKMIKEAKDAGFTGVGIYDNALHFDVGDRRAWGPDYHRGSIPGWAQDAVANLTGGAGSGSGVTVSTSGAPETAGSSNDGFLAQFIPGMAEKSTGGVPKAGDDLDALMPDMSDKAQRRRRLGTVLSGLGVGFGQMSRGAVVDISDVLDAHMERQNDMQGRIAEIMGERRRIIERNQGREWDLADAERLAEHQRELLDLKEKNDDQNAKDAAELEKIKEREAEAANNANLQKAYDGLVISNPALAAQVKPLLGTGEEGWSQVAGLVGDPTTADKASATAEKIDLLVETGMDRNAAIRQVVNEGTAANSDNALAFKLFKDANKGNTTPQQDLDFFLSLQDKGEKTSVAEEELARMVSSGIPENGAVAIQSGVVKIVEPPNGKPVLFDTTTNSPITPERQLELFGTSSAEEVAAATVPTDPTEVPVPPATTEVPVTPVPTVPNDREPLPVANPTAALSIDEALPNVTEAGMVVKEGFTWKDENGNIQLIPGANADWRNAYGAAGIGIKAGNTLMDLIGAPVFSENVSDANAQITVMGNEILSTIRSGYGESTDAMHITKLLEETVKKSGGMAGYTSARKSYEALSEVLQHEIDANTKALERGSLQAGNDDKYRARLDAVIYAKQLSDQIAANLSDPVNMSAPDISNEPPLTDAEIEALMKEAEGL